MSPIVRQLTSCACLAWIAVVGCGSPESTPSAVDSVVTPATETTPLAEEAAAAKPKPTSRPAKRVAKYRPPFPRRTELFVPPSTGRRLARRSNDDYDQSVELMGFADVGRPHAVLSIDGVVSPVAQGGEQNGVQVISIHPPISAVLQRGRDRWTATLD